MKDEQQPKQQLEEEELENVSGGNTYFWQKKSQDGPPECFYVDKNNKPNSWILYGPDQPGDRPGMTIAKPIKKGTGTGWEPNSGIDD